MKLRFFISFVFAIGLVNHSQSQNLTIAFTNAPQLEIGVKAYAANQQIGHVTDIKPSKNFDTIFVMLKITKNIKIPSGSIFYIDEGLIGTPKINVEYSNSKSMLTSKDISIGVFRPIKELAPLGLDSSKINLQKLRPPGIDIIKH
jgi:hypothetical protein